MKTSRIVFSLIVVMLLSFGQSYAAMMNDNGMDNGSIGNGPASSGAMMNGAMMQNNGAFGMMNGLAGSPVVGDDGTAYLVAVNPTAKPGKTPTYRSFSSELIAVGPAGETVTQTFDGLLSRPVISGNTLVATASLPDMNDYQFTGNGATQPATAQSVLYVLSLPLTASSVPVAVSLDGRFASVPVIAGGLYYVSTTDFGSAMMQGSNMFDNMYGKYNYSKTSAGATYLYVINPDLTIAFRAQVQ